MTEDAIVKVDNQLSYIDPAHAKDRALAVAAAVRDIVMVCTQNIQGRRYVKVEGWQAIANTYGCVACAEGVKKVDGGWEAHATVIHLATGRVIGKGEGFVGEDEKMWMGRPLYARRSMAQTRAIGKACRSTFAFIIPMIDAGLQTTPAEEIPEDDEPPAPKQRSAPPRTNVVEGKVVADRPGPEDIPPHDAVTGELLDHGTIGNTVAADEVASEARVRGAKSPEEALSAVNAAPPILRKKLIAVYRETWVK